MKVYLVLNALKLSWDNVNKGGDKVKGTTQSVMEAVKSPFGGSEGEQNKW